MGFDPITYGEIRLLREHFELLNGSYKSILFLLDPSITQASFVAWMNTAGNQASFEQLSKTNAMTPIVKSATAMAAVAASSTAMAAVAASSTAMAAVAASSTAMAAVAASSTAMAAMNASELAMDELYKSPLATRVNFGSAGGVWPNTVTLRSGATLFVRLTTKHVGEWFGEGNVNNEFMSFDGSNVAYAERSANPYNHTALTSTPRLPMRRCAAHLKIKPYHACEITYIALVV